MSTSSSSTILTADFCVIGGGMAGVCAALAAARNGARVILVQDRSVLGGNASSEIRMHIVGASCHGTRPGARETGVIEELQLEDAARNPQRAFPLWDVLLYEKVRENPRIQLLLDSHCYSCVTEATPGGRRIIRAHVRRPLTEENFTIEAPFFADCSGDGRLGFEAGADFRVGREARSEFGESLALPEADRQTLGSSILFTARRHESPQPFLAPNWVRPFRKEEFKLRPLQGYEYGYWWAEWGGQLDTIKDHDTIRHELLRIALGLWNYVKNSGNHPNAANWALEWVGALPGKRESRRFLGDHVLCQQDIESGRIFPDQVAYGGWWLDLHPPSGIDAYNEEPCVQHHLDHLYSVPIRALYSRNVENLFFAGRNISATHVAFASTRVMATCAVIGQAVGTAAALLSRQAGPRDSIRNLCHGTVLAAIQQSLLRDDAFLPGIRNDDPDDLARTSSCQASSSLEGRPPESVLSGVTREIRSEWGSWAKPALHCWESASLPAWIELTLSQPAPIREVHLTFCSSLPRELILSASDHATARTIRGFQPEIVRDYNILVDGVQVLVIRGNYLRKRVHRLPDVASGSSLKIEVMATNGAPSARIFEVRVYGTEPPGQA